MSVDFMAIIERDVETIRQQLGGRCQRAAMELKAASLEVLNHAGSGRVYHGHVASAPGEPPAPDTGAFRDSWQPSAIISGDSYISRIESNHSVNGYNLGSLLENGTSKMAPRPHQEKIKEQALPKALAIYSEPYL